MTDAVRAQGEKAWWTRALLLGVAVKVLYLVLGPAIGDVHGDSLVYLGAIDNLIDRGVYTVDFSDRAAFAARMPGYLFPYGVLRLALTRDAAIVATCLLQAILDGVAVVAVGMLVLHAGGSRLKARLAASIYLGSTYVSIWNRLPLPESFSASAAVLGLWAACAAARGARPLGIWVAGVLFAWVAFLKAYFVAILLALWLLLGLASRGSPSLASWRRALGRCALVLVPFVVCDSLWVLRNWIVLQEFVPLQQGLRGGYKYGAGLLALEGFIKAAGGDIVAWRPGAEIRWFDEFAYQTRSTAPNYTPPSDPPPPHLVTTRCDASELRRLRFQYLLSQDVRVSDLERSNSAEAARNGLSVCTRAYRTEKPFDAWVTARWRVLARYVLHSGTYNLFPQKFAELSMPQKVFKLTQSALYLSVLLLGTIGAVRALAAFLSNPVAAACAIPVLSQLFAFPLVLGASEPRYLVLGFPFLVVCAALAIEAGALPRPAWNLLKA